MRQAHAPIHVTRNTKLQGAQPPPEPMMRSTNFCASKNFSRPDKSMRESPQLETCQHY